MLKFCFGVLLAVNAALFAYGQGYLGHFDSEEHEPARLKNQLNAKRLVVVSAARASTAGATGTASATSTASAAVAAEAAAPPKKAETPVACLEVGAFLLADARRFEAQLAALELGERQARRNVPG